MSAGLINNLWMISEYLDEQNKPMMANKVRELETRLAEAERALREIADMEWEDDIDARRIARAALPSESGTP